MKASVLVPVYNPGPYLSRCLDSILAQTWTDFEVICIDDGSTDGSGDVLDAYARKDRRFRVFHQENKGIGQTRETALKKATGELIFWCDADDRIQPDLLNKAISAFEHSSVDMVIYGHREVTTDGQILKTWIPPTKPIPYWRQAALRAELSVLWTCAFRKNLWEEIRIPPIFQTAGEDGYMVLSLCEKARTVAVISDALYEYTIDNQHSIHHSHSSHYYYGNGSLWLYRMHQSKVECPKLLPFCAGRALSGLVKAYCMTLIDQNLSEKERQHLKEQLMELPESSIKGRYKEKLLHWAIQHHWTWLCRLYAHHKIKKSGHQ